MSHTGGFLCSPLPPPPSLPSQLLKVSGREALPLHLAEGGPPVSPLRLSPSVCNRLFLLVCVHVCSLPPSQNFSSGGGGALLAQFISTTLPGKLQELQHTVG